MKPNDFRRIALSMPEASEGAHMAHPDFPSRRKDIRDPWLPRPALWSGYAFTHGAGEVYPGASIRLRARKGRVGTARQHTRSARRR